MIIDVHAHLGEDYVFDIAQTEQTLLDGYDACSVDKAIIQPFMYRPYLEDMRQAHDRIARFCKAHPGRFYGMASINPHFRPEDYEREAVRCMHELGFVGLKISTIGTATDPSSKDGLHVFEVARALGVPVMIHTGNGAPLADPVSAWNAIEQFPTVKTVLAHTGGNSMQQQAVLLAKKYDNVYLEPSWMPSVCIASMIQQVGASRVMFSSDEAGNLEPALHTFRAMAGSEENLKWVLAKTAQEVYGI